MEVLGKKAAPICGLSKPLSPCSKFNCYCTPCALHFPIYVAVADIYLCILLLSQFWWQILLVVTYKPSVFWLGTMPNLSTRSGSSLLLLQQHIEHLLHLPQLCLLTWNEKYTPVNWHGSKNELLACTVVFHLHVSSKHTFPTLRFEKVIPQLDGVKFKAFSLVSSSKDYIYIR